MRRYGSGRRRGERAGLGVGRGNRCEGGAYRIKICGNDDRGIGRLGIG
jgi:hypothetical protein